MLRAVSATPTRSRRMRCCSSRSASPTKRPGKCDVALMSYERYLKEAKPSPQFIEMTNERIRACGGSAGATAPDFAHAAEIYRAAAAATWPKAITRTRARGFGTAYEMTKDAVLFFKIGFAYEKAGKYDVALTSYDRYLKEAKPSQKFRRDDQGADQRRCKRRPSL